MARNQKIIEQETFIMQKQLYSITALFDSPDEIILAAEKTSKAGSLVRTCEKLMTPFSLLWGLAP